MANHRISRAVSCSVAAALAGESSKSFKVADTCSGMMQWEQDLLVKAHNLFKVAVTRPVIMQWHLPKPVIQAGMQS